MKKQMHTAVVTMGWTPLTVARFRCLSVSDAISGQQQRSTLSTPRGGRDESIQP